MSFTTAQIPDLSGRSVLITGGNSGLGLATAHALYARNANITIACRSPQKGQDAVRAIKEKTLTSTGSVELLNLDLSSVKSTVEAAEEYTRNHDKLDILFANAGIAMEPYQLSVDGYERQFATNHLGHFAFITTLLPLLQRTAAAKPEGDVRVIITSSEAHRFTYKVNNGIDFSAMRGEKRKPDVDPTSIWELGDAFRRYGQSKLANILFTRELSRRLKSSHPNIYVNAIHPGAVATGLTSGGSAFIGPTLTKITNFLMGFLASSAEKGALTQLWAATSEEIVARDYRGEYFIPVAKMGKTTEEAKNEELMRELWKWSEGAVEGVVGKRVGGHVQ
ncbi:NAD(P)-binding protein [Saitoella complicata NRRL Y-17804]|uniref:NAD(P)-binding protein n=1 Tax=Saitoella complicata (strain BCRC 22490 / CBS 7301 / JCM 7358 / NBRC 10748 / NRRL Y-17804) TaxID=698492 RepID=UPI0008673CAA|nr:NAD(P)-binding protein [Saitoella complicata NRRL Y-17804]ODQ56507.1 NAD(P)-binding protein [Saitoella complicata NRRL Y-17804]